MVVVVGQADTEIVRVACLLACLSPVIWMTFLCVSLGGYK